MLFSPKTCLEIAHSNFQTRNQYIVKLEGESPLRTLDLNFIPSGAYSSASSLEEKILPLTKDIIHSAAGGLMQLEKPPGTVKNMSKDLKNLLLKTEAPIILVLQIEK